jgi:hypothetical protein
MLGLYELFGLRATPFHATSVALHLVNTLLVWLIARRLTQRAAVPAIAAAVFALHPGYVEAVAWISNSASLLAVTTSLCSLWCFMQADGATRRRRTWYRLSLFAFAVTPLFHPESGVMLLVIVGYRLLSLPRISRETLRGPALELAPFVVPLALYVAVHRWMVSQDYLFISDQFSLGTQVVKQYLGYLGMLAYPREPTHVGSTFPSPGYAVGATLVIIGIALLLAFARGRPQAGRLAAIWLLVAILPITTLNLGAFGPGLFGRKLYVAGPPFALVVACMSAPLIDAVMTWGRKPAVALLLFAGLTLAALAGHRIVENEQAVTYQSSESESFISQLRSAYPTIPADSRLFILALPPGLAFSIQFGDAYVTDLVDLYYEDVDVTVFPDAQELATARPQDVTFRYASGDAPAAR